MFFKNILHFFTKQDQDNSIILIVDDNPSDLAHSVNIASKAGYNVLKARNGKEGLALAKKHIPDLVILDIDLPDILGFKLCQELKEYHPTKDIPIIFLTVLDSPKIILDSYELGAENYLLKPVSASTLVKQINLALKDHSLQTNEISR